MIAAFLFRNPILSAVLESRLSALTGGEAMVRGARFEGLSGVRIETLRVRAPGWPGDAGEVFLVEGLDARLRLQAILQGRFGFDRVRMDRVRVRIAESAEDPARLNVTSFGGPDDARDETETSDRLERIGAILIDRLDVETGVADGSDWRPEAFESYHAVVDPLDPEGRSHEFQLASLEAGRPVAIAKGILDARAGGFSLRTDEVGLDRISALVLSGTARAVVDAMEITGTLRTATVEWRDGGPPSADLEVDGLAFSPPEIEAFTSQWVRFEDGEILDEESPPLPRVELARGRIRLDGDRLVVRGEGGRLVRDFEPEFLPSTTVSAELNARIKGVSPPENAGFEAWGRALVEAMPFTLEIGVDRFVRTPEEAGGPVDIPRPVAKALRLLTAETWDLTASASVSRGNPEVGVSPEDRVTSTARLELLDGRGMYHEFRYPLHDVRAQLEVSDDRVHVRRLSGLGPDGDILRLSGMIDGLGPDAGVDLQLESDDIGLDEPLLAALPDSTSRALRSLFDELAMERLESVGLIPGPEAIAEDRSTLIERRRALADRLDDPEPGDVAALEDRIERLRTRIENGPFRLGGRGGLNLRIHRPRVEGHPVAVEGTIDLRGVGAIFSRFPYPLVVERGRILLEDLAVVLASPGLEVTTLEGGRGFVSGRVDLPRDGMGGRDVLPDLRIRVRGDAIGPLLFAAVPPDVDGRPSPAAIPGWPGPIRAGGIEPIVDLGLSGTIDYDVAITTDESGDAGFRVDGTLRDGIAHPVAGTERDGAIEEPTWPRDFVIDDVAAVLSIDDLGLELTSFTGRRGGGTIQARATYDFETEIGRGIARLRELPIEEPLLDLVPADTMADVRRLWNRWRPTGRFHADLHWRRADGRADLDVEAEPLWAEFDTGRGRRRVDAERGRILFEEDHLRLEDLALQFEGTEGPDGAVRLAGEYAFGDAERGHRIEGVIDDARFESPVIDEVLTLAVSEGFAEWWRTREPEGLFDGRFAVTTGAEASSEALLEPRLFSLLSRIDDPASRAGGRIEPGGRIVIDDRQVAIGPLAWRSPSDARMDLDLRVADVERPEVLARFAIELPDLGVPEADFLPPPFSNLLSVESVEAEGVKAVAEIAARFSGDEGGLLNGAPRDPDFYRLQGTLDMDALRWAIGGTELETREPTRPWRMELEAVDGVPTWFDLDALLPEVRVASRPIRDVDLRGTLASARSDMPGSIRVRGTQGRLGDGMVRLDAFVDPFTGRYRATVDLTDVALDALSDPTLPRDDDDDKTAGEGSPSRLPGRIWARLGMEGDFEDPESRVGGGRIELRDARLADGGALALLQIGQLMPPIADEMASAEARVLIDGDTVRLDDVSLEADTVRLLGDGTMRLEDWTWSIRLLPRGSLPLVADVVSAISGTLGAIDIAGTPDAPIVTFTPLPVVFGPAGTPNRIEEDRVKVDTSTQVVVPPKPETNP